MPRAVCPLVDPIAPPELPAVAPVGIGRGFPTVDRRGGPRGARQAEIDRFTAATHTPLPLWFGVGIDDNWALVAGISLGPYGMLVRALALPPSGVQGRHEVLTAWRRLATRLGDPNPRSPLWWSTTYARASGLVAELSRRASGSALPVDVLVLADGTELRGHLRPLADPQVSVLGIGLDAPARDQLSRIVLPDGLSLPSIQRAPIPPAIEFELGQLLSAGLPPPHAGRRRRRASRRGRTIAPANASPNGLWGPQESTKVGQRHRHRR